MYFLSVLDWSWIRRTVALSIAWAFLAIAATFGQSADGIVQKVNSGEASPLPNHHPHWANAANDRGLVPPDASFDQMTMVLARSPQQELAFQKFLEAQQNPTSPDYQHWLSPGEIGERFGLSDQDLNAVTGWLASQGLHIHWVAPSRTFVGFGGSAAEIGRAFQTEMHRYNLNGLERISVSSDPIIPQALLPVIKAIRGFYEIEDRPAHHAKAMQSVTPAFNSSNGSHYISPFDFHLIYDLPFTYSGYGQTIGIVGRSRTNFADFDNFRQKAFNFFQNPTEVVPTAFGGVDPGPALTSPPAAGVSIAEQMEATLDVMRAGSVAQSANLLLVVATAASGGIEADAQYLVQTTPVPAQVISISYGGCESSAGPAGVNFWDTLFQQAAAEGISAFVSSGDSGASGCDAPFNTPPASPVPNSPNAICSSSYATCVGGTEFNDTSTPSLYWSSTNGSNLASALSYIPEGGWNEPLNGSNPQVAASGGGVSTVIATPSWQTGTGVPAARSGRYTPDVSFSASCHDGYFGCFAAAGSSCVSDSTGSYRFEYFCGTSASTPSMAGVAAMLDEKLGRGQGNLNPQLYQVASTAPTAFHEVTVATSGVSGCVLTTPSMCNSSIPSPSGLSGGQMGFPVTAGYDEVTGLGSLDVQQFLNDYAPTKLTPTVSVSLSSTAITQGQALTVTVTLTANDSIPINGTLIVTSGNYSSGPVEFLNAATTVQIAAGWLAPGNDTITATYAPSSLASLIYNGASGSSPVTVTAVPKTTPSVIVSPSSANITTAQGLVVTIAVNPTGTNAVPSGTVALVSGTYSSGPLILSNGSAIVDIAAGILASGTDVLTPTYAPDTPSSAIYFNASGSASVAVTFVPKITPTVSITLTPPSFDLSLPYTATISVFGGSGNQAPSGTVKLNAGATAIGTATVFGGGTVSIFGSAGSLPLGTDTLTAVYTPDAAGALVYNSASGSTSVTVTKIAPVLQVQSFANVSTTQTLMVSVVVNDYGASQPATGAIALSSGGFISAPVAVTPGYASTATISVPPGSLPAGTDVLTVTYTPDAAASSIYSGSSNVQQSVTVTKATPVVLVTPTNSVVTSAQDVPVTVSLFTDALTATGSVTVSGGSYTSPAAALSGGSAVVTVPGGLLPVGADTLTASYAPDAAGALLFNSSSGSNSVTVIPAPPPGFNIGGSPVTVARGATTGNTCAITVTSVTAFAGSVTLTAAITSSPIGTQFPPVLSFGSTSPVSLTSAAPATATLTIATTASTAAALAPPPRPAGRWCATSGLALAGILICLVPRRRDQWLVAIRMLALFVFLSGVVLACGGGGGGSTGSGGTTQGAYTITITGTSGTTTGTGFVTLNVQ